MPRYTYSTCLSFGTDGEADYREVDVEVSFTVAWGRPAQTYGPAERCYPADPDELDDIRLEKVWGKPRPWGMYDGYVADEDNEFERVVIERLEGLEAEMMVEAAEQAAADHAAADEYRAEQRREASYGL
jgi:hypothetical protein